MQVSQLLDDVWKQGLKEFLFVGSLSDPAIWNGAKDRGEVTSPCRIAVNEERDTMVVLEALTNSQYFGKGINGAMFSGANDGQYTKDRGLLLDAFRQLFLEILWVHTRMLIDTDVNEVVDTDAKYR